MSYSPYFNESKNFQDENQSVVRTKLNDIFKTVSQDLSNLDFNLTETDVEPGYILVREAIKPVSPLISDDEDANSIYAELHNCVQNHRRKVSEAMDTSNSLRKKSLKMFNCLKNESNTKTSKFNKEYQLTDTILDASSEEIDWINAQIDKEINTSTFMSEKQFLDKKFRNNTSNTVVSNESISNKNKINDLNKYKIEEQSNDSIYNSITPNSTNSNIDIKSINICINNCTNKSECSNNNESTNNKISYSSKGTNKESFNSESIGSVENKFVNKNKNNVDQSKSSIKLFKSKSLQNKLNIVKNKEEYSELNYPLNMEIIRKNIQQDALAKDYKRKFEKSENFNCVQHHPDELSLMEKLIELANVDYPSIKDFLHRDANNNDQTIISSESNNKIKLELNYTNLTDIRKNDTNRIINNKKDNICNSNIIDQCKIYADKIETKDVEKSPDEMLKHNFISSYDKALETNCKIKINGVNSNDVRIKDTAVGVQIENCDKLFGEISNLKQLNNNFLVNTTNKSIGSNIIDNKLDSFRRSFISNESSDESSPDDAEEVENSRDAWFKQRRERRILAERQ